MQSNANLPTVSVALCTHNGERFIAEQLRSILHQSVLPRQVVLSDDASTDATVQIAKEVFSRFRAERNGAAPGFTLVLNKKALGVTANFEQAVRACTNELVALCDQDDVWLPNRLAVMAAEFAARPELTLLFSDARLVDDAGEPLGHSLFEAIELSAAEKRKVRAGLALDVLLRRNVVTGATTVFSRRLLGAALPFPESWVHDEWLAMMASITGTVDFLPRQLIDYRQHGGNQIGARRPTLGDRVGKLREPREERNQRLLARAAALALRLKEWEDIPEAVVKLARQKLTHEQVRSSLSRSRPLRVFPVLLEALSGRYGRFGRARFDIARDLLQSPK